MDCGVFAQYFDVARIRAARHYQKPDAPVHLIALRGKAGLKRDFRAALPHLRDVFDKKRALYLLQHGRVRELRDAIDWGHYREVLKAVFDRWAKVYEAGAALGARKINGSHHAKRRKVRFRKVGNLLDLDVVTKAIGDRFTFDRFDQVTQDRLKQVQDDLIKQTEADAIDTIHAVVIRGQQLGYSPADTVDDIWNVIGLNDQQAVAVMNYENMLRDLDPDALRRQLRADDLDGVVRRAIENGEALDEAVISELVDAYEANYLDYRADTIAQTESVRAANWGLHDAYSQAIERGALPDEAVKRFWQLGDHPCPICESIPDANPDGVGANEDFDSDDGPQDDPPIHPNCMCSVEYVTDLSLVPDDEGEEE